MNILKSIIVIALAIILFSACKKEGPEGPQGPIGLTGPTGSTTAVNPAVYGKWQVISGMPGTSYYILKSNNYLYRLDSAAYGFKSLASDMALMTYTQIFAFWTTFNYSISNDTLRLTNLNNNIILKKKANAPDETEWVTYLTVIDSIVSPTGGDGREDLGFDGSNILWTASSSSNTLYKINPSSHVVSTLPLSTSYYYGGCNYASTQLWISDDFIINNVNPATGAVISTSPVLCSSTITSLALAGSLMYYSDWLGNFYTWDIISNDITPMFSYYINGMEYVGGFLYIYSYHEIHKCQLSPFEVVTTYYIDYPHSSGNCGGLTYDGSNFWIVGYNYSTSDHLLYKLTL